MNCWICGSKAQTGEHVIKASDMRSIFGHIRQSQPVYRHSASRRNVPAKGINTKILKSGALLCARCNNQRTQPYDRAWETLSLYVRSRPQIRCRDRIKLGKVFPGAVHRSMLNVHLFFVKLFGCLVVENSVPIDIGDFSSAILNNAAHPKVHLAISPYTDGIASGSAGYSNLDTAQLNRRVVYATWLYILDRFSIRVIYAEPTEHRKGLIDSWHPSSIKKCIRISSF
jgi:hypothetical protein